MLTAIISRSHSKQQQLLFLYFSFFEKDGLIFKGNQMIYRSHHKKN